MGDMPSDRRRGRASRWNMDGSPFVRSRSTASGRGIRLQNFAIVQNVGHLQLTFL